MEDLLLSDEDLTSEVYVCPSSQDERATGETPQEVARRLSEPGHLSYVYAARGKSRTAGDDVVLAYDRPVNHPVRTGINVLYGDGHVEFESPREVEWILAELGAGHNPPRMRQQTK